MYSPRQGTFAVDVLIWIMYIYSVAVSILEHYYVVVTYDILLDRIIACTSRLQQPDARRITKESRTSSRVQLQISRK